MNNDFTNNNQENEENKASSYDTSNQENQNEPTFSENIHFTTGSSSNESEKHDHTVEWSKVPPPPPPPASKPRKTPTWVIILICVIGSLYLIISAVLLGSCSSILNKTLSQNQVQSDASQKPTSDAQNNESASSADGHLKTSESPKSKGAKTTDDALTVKEISQKVKKSVVGIACQTTGALSSSSVGSGIIMSNDGYIITNNHVVEGTSIIQVVLDSGETYTARLIGADARSDLAVIKIEETNLPVAEFGDSDMLEQGDPAVAIGNPAGLELQNTVTYGIISAINRDIIVEDREMTLIQTDASINPGNSGGPLVNEFGQVIGINTVKIGVSYYEGLGFAIPINTAKPIIDELISNGYIKGRPSIGINGIEISEEDAKFYGLPAGFYVEYVHPYSDAYKKGLRRGDIITKMNGTKLGSTAEIKKIRDQFTAGDTVTLTVYRGTKEVDLKVVLMDEATLSGNPANNS